MDSKGSFVAKKLPFEIFRGAVKKRETFSFCEKGVFYREKMELDPMDTDLCNAVFRL